jgi:two-component system OmpR family sensor kinase
LRTPLAVLVARMDGLPADGEFDRLRADVLALSRTVTQLLTSAGADRMEIDPNDRADLRRVAEQTVAQLVPFARLRGTAIELSAAAGPVMVRGSADAIALALTNLIENAVLHGGGAPVRVTVGPGPELTVQDRGPGLPEAARATLFQPFWRGSGAQPGGAGLGLAIVQRIQRAHGGTVEAANAPEGGARFRLSYRPC